MSITIARRALAPTVEAIDEWLGREKRQSKAGEPSYSVNVRTKAGSLRCICGLGSRVEEDGHVWYWTIRGEGSSNEGRETAIRADKIVYAEGWIVGDNVEELL